MGSAVAFILLETTIDAIHQAYKSGQLTTRQLVQMYVDRIAAYDKTGPTINAIITLNAKTLEAADRLDATFKVSGFVGPLHGIPVVVKDQADVAGMPTTLGSVLFQHYYPDRDCFVVENLRRAGAIILGKTTLGELGGGDTHGSLFGSTRNPYDLERTVGGSSGSWTGEGNGTRMGGQGRQECPPHQFSRIPPIGTDFGRRKFERSLWSRATGRNACPPNKPAAAHFHSLTSFSAPGRPAGTS